MPVAELCQESRSLLCGGHAARCGLRALLSRLFDDPQRSDFDMRQWPDYYACRSLIPPRKTLPTLPLFTVLLSPLARGLHHLTAPRLVICNALQQTCHSQHGGAGSAHQVPGGACPIPGACSQFNASDDLQVCATDHTNQPPLRLLGDCSWSSSRMWASTRNLSASRR